MTEPDEFLKRWSKRKQSERRKGDKENNAPARQGDGGDPESQTQSEQAALDSGLHGKENRETEQFNVSSLPPVDSINSTTDVTAFLRKGVPAELTREALRRAWVADPAIRNFIGLSENAWDFNDPNAMGGFGPLDLSQDRVREMLYGLFESKQLAVKPEDAAPPGTVGTAMRPDAAEPELKMTRLEPPAAEVPSTPSTPAQGLRDDAAQQEDGEPPARRTHGSALPR